MKKTDARNLILKTLGPILEPSGFRAKKRAEGFVRKIEGGEQILGVALWDYRPLIEFSLHMCVRLEEVQALVNTFSGSPPKYHAETLTSITQLEFLGEAAEAGRGVIYRASSDLELLTVLEPVACLVRDRVVPFFEQYRDLKSLDRGLNPEGAERMSASEWLDNPRSFAATNQPYRAMTGVTVAFLTGNPRFPALVEAYRSHLNALLDQERKKYEQLVAHLLKQEDSAQP